MKFDKERLQVAAIGILMIAALLAFWAWFISEVITNEPKFFLYMLIWLGPILAIPLLRFIARLRMSKEERELDDLEADGEKGTAIASLMTVWFLGWPLFLWIFG